MTEGPTGGGVGDVVEEKTFIPVRFSRRRMLAGTGLLIGGATVGGNVLAACTDDDEGATPDGNGNGTAGGVRSSDGARLQSLSVAQAQTMDSLAERIIPEDGDGPGARTAMVVLFVDQVLATMASDRLSAYQANLARLDELAAERGAGDGGFPALESTQQDEIVASLAADEASGFVPSAAGFFSEAREHVIQGMFGDPVYRGNQGGAGWQLMGYPGIRMQVPEETQQIGAEVDAEYRSAYSYDSIGLQMGGG